MAEWNQQEMEELIAKMTKKAMTDASFRKEVLEDATSALEKLAGKPLPEGMTLKCVERDPNFQNTLVLPDLVDEEKLDEDSLSSVAGGISFALIISICAAAAGVGPDVATCGAKGGVAEYCKQQLCGQDTCRTRTCGEYS